MSAAAARSATGIIIVGCPGNASATSVVGVNIIHPRVTDLNVLVQDIVSGATGYIDSWTLAV